MRAGRRRRPQRIVLVIGSARPGGAEGQMVRLACELHRRGRDVLMLFQVFGGPLTVHLDEAGVPWRVLRPLWPPTSRGRNLFAYLNLGGAIARFRPDVVCAWLPGAIWPTLLLAQVLTSARRVAGLRGRVLQEELRWQAPLLRAALRRAHCVTVNTPTLTQTAVRWGADPAGVRFIANGVDLPPHRAQVAVQPPRAVVVANFRTYKGHDTLVDAVATVGEELQVRLCGEGEERERISARVVDEHLVPVITLVDEPADVPRELLHAQFAVHPSTTEGLSNAILEELSFGLPVVATDVGGTHLLVRDGVTGYLVPAGDASAMSRAIARLARSPETRVRMSHAARAHADAFSWEACVSAYEALFRRLLDGAEDPV